MPKRQRKIDHPNCQPHNKNSAKVNIKRKKVQLQTRCNLTALHRKRTIQWMLIIIICGMLTSSSHDTSEKPRLGQIEQKQ